MLVFFTIPRTHFSQPADSLAKAMVIFPNILTHPSKHLR